MNGEKRPLEEREIIERIQKRKSGKKRRRAELAARALMGVEIDPEVVRESVEAVEATFERLQELHRELAAERSMEPAPAPVAPGWTRRKKVLVAAPIAVAAVLLGLFLFLFVGREPAGEPVGMVRSARGEVEVTDSKGETSVVTKEMEVYEDYTVNTKRDSLAVITLNGDSHVRLDSDASIRIDGVEDGDARLSYMGGRTYYRLDKGSSLRVRLDGARVVADGVAAFNISEEGGGMKLMAVYGDVEIEDSTGGLVVKQGEEVSLTATSRVASLDTVKVTQEEIEGDWFIWNRKQDEGEGFDPGILEGIDEEPVDQEPQPPVEQEPQPQQEPTQEGSRPQPVVPQPASMSLGTSVEATRVTLNFAMQNPPAHDAVAVLRSESNPQPSYPADLYAQVGPGATSYVDQAVSGDVTYYYRTCAVSGGAPVLYSDVAQAAVPLWGEVGLTGSWTGSSVALSFSSNANFYPTMYVVCRTSDGSVPVFPPATGTAWLIRYSGNTGSFTDDEVSPGGAYSYRVGLMLGSDVVVYSNTVSVQVPR